MPRHGCCVVTERMAAVARGAHRGPSTFQRRPRKRWQRQGVAKSKRLSWTHRGAANKQKLRRVWAPPVLPAAYYGLVVGELLGKALGWVVDAVLR